MKITKSQLKQIIKEELEATMQEDGHEDVPSAVRAMKTIIEDAGEMLTALSGMTGTLPTWWTNKMANAAHALNKMRDYLLVDSETVSEGDVVRGPWSGTPAPNPDLLNFVDNMEEALGAKLEDLYGQGDADIPVEKYEQLQVVLEEVGKLLDLPAAVEEPGRE